MNQHQSIEAKIKSYEEKHFNEYLTLRHEFHEIAQYLSKNIIIRNDLTDKTYFLPIISDNKLDEILYINVDHIKTLYGRNNSEGIFKKYKELKTKSFNSTYVLILKKAYIALNSNNLYNMVDFIKYNWDEYLAKTINLTSGDYKLIHHQTHITDISIFSLENSKKYFNNKNQHLDPTYIDLIPTNSKFENAKKTT